LSRQLERETFADEALIDLLAEINTVKADVSLNNKRDKTLMSKYNIFGPPTILIFNTGGEEQKNLRKIGLTKADELLNDLNRLRDTQAKLLGANL
jgi:thiol:disulfide interchange protein DsbD